MTHPKENLTLRVKEAQAKDVGRAIARIDPEDMKSLGIEVGEIVLIEGKRKTPAKAMPLFLEDRGQKVIQIDGILRENAQVGLDEKLNVKKVSHRPASRITLSPMTSVGSFQKEKDIKYIGSLMEGLPLTVGDKVRAALFGARSCDFKVIDTSPDGIVVIEPTTLIRMEIKGTKE